MVYSRSVTNWQNFTPNYFSKFVHWTFNVCATISEKLAKNVENSTTEFPIEIDVFSSQRS